MPTLKVTSWNVEKLDGRIGDSLSANNERCRAAKVRELNPHAGSGA